MQYVNHIDTAFTVAEILDSVVRDTLSVLFWGLGRTVDFFTCRKAIRSYCAVGSAAMAVLMFVIGFVQAARQF